VLYNSSVLSPYAEGYIPELDRCTTKDKAQLQHRIEEDFRCQEISADEREELLELLNSRFPLPNPEEKE
jgi:hypothetical protein